MRKPVSFFLVEYDPSDLFAFPLALLSYTPPFLVAIQTAVFLTLMAVDLASIPGRTTQTSPVSSSQLNQATCLAGLLLLGQLINELLNLVLKNTLKHPRPPTSNTFNYSYTDYGLPSSHSQFMAFLGAIFPGIVEKLGGALSLHRAIKFLLITGCYIGTFLIAFGRVYLGYHSAFQVLAGLVVGFSLGVLWNRQIMNLSESRRNKIK